MPSSDGTSMLISSVIVRSCLQLIAMQSLCLRAGGQRSLCLKVFAFICDVGSHTGVFLRGASLGVKAYGDGVPLALVLSRDVEDPSCKLRVVWEATVDRDVYRRYLKEIRLSLGPMVRPGSLQVLFTVANAATLACNSPPLECRRLCLRGFNNICR